MFVTKKYGYSAPTQAITGEHETVFTALAATDDANYWVSYTIDAPIADSYILLPACAYDGNRFATYHHPYPPMFYEEDLRLAPPVTMTEVPRLASEGDSFLDVTTGDLATPCVCVLRKSTREAFLLFTEQGCHGRNFGISLEQIGDSLEIRLTAPSKRRLVYRWYPEEIDGECKGVPSLRPNPEADPPVALKSGERTVIPHRTYHLPCADIPALYRIFFEKREELYRAGAHACLPFSAFWDMAEEQQNLRHYDVAEKFYHNMAFKANPSRYDHWQAGWVGGGISTLAMLTDGQEITKARAIETLEYAAKHQSAKGFFYGLVFQGKVHHDCFGRFEGKYNLLLTRKQADMVYFLFKQIDILQKSGRAVPETILQSAISAADALAEVWETYGQLGQFINAETGEIVVGGSTSGGVAPSGLCAAAMVTGKERYAEIARQIARYYYETAILTGVTTGGPGEILQAPDSESVAGLVESYMALYEMDGTDEWLQMCRDAVHQAASWVVAYDYEFPKESRFGRRGICAAGSVWANVQNKHSAPGLCTHSAASLLKLYRATGDRAYLHLMQEIAHFIPQVASRPDCPMETIGGGVCTLPKCASASTFPTGRATKTWVIRFLDPPVGRKSA